MRKVDFLTWCKRNKTRFKTRDLQGLIERIIENQDTFPHSRREKENKAYLENIGATKEELDMFYTAWRLYWVENTMELDKNQEQRVW